MKAFLIAVFTMIGVMAMADTKGVIEVATLQLADGVSPEAFAPVDRAVEDTHVGKQPGFISRQSGFDGTAWVVVVNWASLADAEASMASFASAPAAAQFMGMIDASTLVMTRYQIAN